LRLVPVAVDDAEEAVRLVAVVDDLVGRQGRHVNDVKRPGFVHVVADDNFALAPKRHDDVNVLVLLQRGVPARAYFEVAQPERARLTESPGDDLARDVPPRFARTLAPDRKSTRLNSSHVKISYAVFCLKK